MALPTHRQSQKRDAATEHQSNGPRSGAFTESEAVRLADGTVIRFVSRITAPIRARAWPSRIVAPVVSVILVNATMLPVNAVLVPRVAELPTCQ